MSTYKITNITNTVEKRNAKHNSILNVEYVDGMEKKNVSIKPNETIFITISSLPLSVQRLRVKNLISVIEIDSKELNKAINETKPKVVQTVKSSNDAESKLKEREKQYHSSSKKKSKKEDDVTENAE